MSKYTQGPYKTEYNSEEGRFYVVHDDTACTDTAVCRIELYNVSSPHERKATADLLSAAPALLEALERITNEAVLDGLSDKAGWDCWIINAKTAIEEAGGEI